MPYSSRIEENVHVLCNSGSFMLIILLFFFFFFFLNGDNPAIPVCQFPTYFEALIDKVSETLPTNAGLVDYVERTVKSESSRAPDRPVYLVGESVGACIALAVAARNPDIDLILILVNPGLAAVVHGFCVALFFQ